MDRGVGLVDGATFARPDSVSRKPGGRLHGFEQWWLINSDVSHVRHHALLLRAHPPLHACDRRSVIEPARCAPGPQRCRRIQRLSALRRRHGGEHRSRHRRAGRPTAAAGPAYVAPDGRGRRGGRGIGRRVSWCCRRIAGASAGAAVLAAGGTLVRTGAAAAETLHAASLLRPIATGTMLIGTQMSVAGILQQDSSLLWRGMALGSVGGLDRGRRGMPARPPANMPTLIEAVGMLTRYGRPRSRPQLVDGAEHHERHRPSQDLATRPASQLHPVSGKRPSAQEPMPSNSSRNCWRSHHNIAGAIVGGRLRPSTPEPRLQGRPPIRPTRQDQRAKHHTRPELRFATPASQEGAAGRAGFHTLIHVPEHRPRCGPIEHPLDCCRRAQPAGTRLGARRRRPLNATQLNAATMIELLARPRTNVTRT
jgi:hypothetical protein